MSCPQIDSSVLSTGMSWESTLVYYRLINEEVRQRLGGLHRVAEQIATAMAIPLLHIGAMDHDFYVGRLRDRCALRVLLPGPVDRATVNRVIFEELVKGVVDDGSRAEYSRIISDLAADGADAILLACTEIGLLVGSGDSPVPVYDTAELHARAAVELALGQRL